MKKIFAIFIASFILILGAIPVPTLALTGGDVSKENFMLSVDKLFPSFGTTDKIEDSSGKGVNNITGLIASFIPMLTTMMAIGATLMVVWGGFNMVLGGASTERTEAGKSIMKDAVIGLVLGLLAYVIIAFLGNILNI